MIRTDFFGIEFMTDQWHLKKEVNITHIFATIGLVVSVFVYSSTLEKRIQTNEQTLEFIKTQRSEDLGRAEKKFDMIMRKLDEIQKALTK